MRPVFLFVICAVFFFTGCASARESKRVVELKKDLSVVSNKFELAKKENLNLRRELMLFKRYQDIDSHTFIDALGVFEKELAKEITDNNIWVRLSDRGLVVTVSAEELFLSGSDALSEGGKVLLDRISGLIQKNFSSNYVYIEGHADNQSLAVFEWKSDWDFSFARALTVLKYLEEKKGIDPLRLSASGFGQYRPRATNDTKDGRRLNRRIEIIISPQKLTRG